MRVAIFTDYSPSIGQGHLTRCCALASWLAEQGCTPTVYVDSTRKELGLLSTQDLKKCQVQIQCWVENLRVVYQALSAVDFVVVDSYRVDQPMVDLLESQAGNLLFIDDFHHFHYRKAWVVDWSLGLEQHPPTGWRGYPKALMGLDYAVLRSTFCAPLPVREFGVLREVFVTLGGGETSSHFAYLATRLAQSFPDLQFYATSLEQSKAPVDLPNLTYVGRLDSSAMRMRMREADLVVCGLGQTAYEVLSQATPIIPIALVDNQAGDIAAWRAAHFAPFVLRGDAPELFALLHNAIEVMRSEEVRAEISACMGTLALREGVARLMTRIGIILPHH